MKNYCGILILTAMCTLSLCLAGCGTSAEPEKKEVVIQVNNSKICLEEFNDLMKFEAYADPEMELTAETRDQFINYLVRKELLIQEAAKLKLDSKKEFVLTIEKYWEATLIRNLLELKSIELKKKILITDDEIKAYYTENKDDFSQPYDAVKASIKESLESKKLAAELEAWTLGLKKSADITINEALIRSH